MGMPTLEDILRDRISELESELNEAVNKANQFNAELFDYRQAEEQGVLIKRDCTGCKRLLYNNGDCNICVRKATDFYEEALKGGEGE
jgi:hypothetical protein